MPLDDEYDHRRIIDKRSRSRSLLSDAGPSQDRKKQRIRPVLACTACKKRKIKCDRNVPCEACIKRGDEANCEWDPQVQPERSKYALVEELERLRDRLELLEGALKNPVTANVCCPPSCSCHDEPKSKSRGAPVVAGGDLPLSELIDQKLGFRRNMESEVAPELSRSSTAACCSGPAVATSTPSIWLDSVANNQPALNTRSLPIMAQFGKDVFVNTVASALPVKTACDALIMAYFQDFDWSCHVIHSPSFYREYDSFWTNDSTRRIHLADPAWLAQLLIMLALGVRCLSQAGLPEGLRGRSHSEIQLWPELFFECSQLALKQAQWTTKPQVRVLQTILLYLSYLDFTNEGPDTLIWIGSAIKIAYLLGLQRLAGNEDAKLTDSCSPGLLKRQLEYRLWICLQSSDLMASASRRQPLGIASPRDDALKHVLNCNDVDLDIDGCPLIHDSSIITDVSFEIIKFRLATHQHQHYEACLEAKGSLSEFDLTRLDRNLRAIMDGIAEPVMPPGGPPFSKSITLLIRRYYMIKSATNYRILRLHRPYMDRGYLDPDYQSSTQACVESALAILNSISYFRTASTSINWFFTLHCIEAILVLFIDIFWKMDHQAPRGAIERNKQDFTTASFMFTAATASFSPQVEQIARLGKALLTKLLEEESARNMVGVNHREPLAEVFKRTAYALCPPQQTENLGQPGQPFSTAGLLPAGTDTWASLFPSTSPLTGPVQGGGNNTDFQMLSDVFGDFNFNFAAEYQSIYPLGDAQNVR